MTVVAAPDPQAHSGITPSSTEKRAQDAQPEGASARQQSPAPVSPLPQWPVYGVTDDPLCAIERWHADGRRVALATLVQITGSSPRPLGSEMAISEDGAVQGYVSGGCVEAAVRAEALACLQDGAPRLLDYGVGSPVLDIHLLCGGRIGILVRLLHDAQGYVAARRRAETRRTPLAVTTDLASGVMRWVEEDRPTERHGTLFTRRHIPPVRLVVAGGDPVVMALLGLARHVGLQTTLLRPLGPDAPPPGLPPEHYVRARLEDAVKDLTLDRWTAVYSLTHDARSDHLLTAHALNSEAFCVSVLGSRVKIPGRLQALRDAGVNEDAFGRLHLPAGIEINARTPMEIALSIVTQIIATCPT